MQKNARNLIAFLLIGMMMVPVSLAAGGPYVEMQAATAGTFIGSAMNAYRIGNYELAQQLLRQALTEADKDPSSETRSTALMMLGIISLTIKEHTQAIQYLEQALPLKMQAMDPNQTEINQIISWLQQAYTRVGKPEEVEKWKQKLSDLQKPKLAKMDVAINPEQFEQVIVENSASPQKSELPMSKLSSSNRVVARSEDYLKDLDKKIIRWNDQTKYLLVHIPTASYVSGWRPEDAEIIKSAFKEWQTALDNRIIFTFMPEPQNVDVTVYWVEKAYDFGSGQVVDGENKTQFWDKYISKNDIYVALKDVNGTPRKPNGLYSIALHEIGHMLGIKGHSSNSEDIMAPSGSFSAERHLTQRDIATIQAIYSRKPDFTNPEGVRLSNFEQFKRSRSKRAWLPIPIPLSF